MVCPVSQTYRLAPQLLEDQGFEHELNLIGRYQYFIVRDELPPSQIPASITFGEVMIDRRQAKYYIRCLRVDIDIPSRGMRTGSQRDVTRDGNSCV